jgi:endo-1,4-beta-D-glucanase Y
MSDITPIFKTAFPSPTFTEFNAVYNPGAGENLVRIENAGVAGDCFEITTNNQNTQVMLAKEIADTTCRRVIFFMKVENGATLTSTADANIFDPKSNQNFTGNLFNVRIKQSGGNKFKIGLQTNFSTFTVDYSTKEFEYGTWWKFFISMKNDRVMIHYYDVAQPAVEVTGLSFSGKTIRSFSLGKNTGTTFATAGNTTKIRFSSLICVPEKDVASSTEQGKYLDACRGTLLRHLTANGCIHQMNELYFAIASNNGNVGYDFNTNSEGMGYGARVAAYLGEKDWFDTIESFRYSKMRRANILNDGAIASSNDAQSVATNCMGWVYDPIRNKMFDANLASDGDINFTLALYKAHTTWSSGGAINYLQRVKDLANDFKTFLFQTWDNKNYQLSDKYPQNEYNPSYFEPEVYRIWKKEDGANSVFWQRAIDGCYDALDKITATSGALATNARIAPNWFGFNENTGQVENPPSYRDINYTYDAIRVNLYVNIDAQLYGEAKATTYLNNQYNFFNSQYNNGTGSIWAEYQHDGSPRGTTYQNTLMYACNSFVFRANGNTTVYNNIWNNEITPGYKHNEAGSYITAEVDDRATNTKSNYFQGFLTAWAGLYKTAYITAFDLSGSSAGSATAGQTQITATPTSIASNGTAQSVITVQLKDASGNNVNTNAGYTVVLSTTVGTLSGITNNNNGTFTASLSSTTAGNATISGTLNGTAITDTAVVTLTAGISGATGPINMRLYPQVGNEKIHPYFLN